MNALTEEWLAPFFTWYLEQMSLATPFKAVLFLLLSYGLFSLLFYIFAFTRRIANLLTYPVRIFHLHDHIAVAREIQHEIEVEHHFQSSTSNLSPSEERTIDLGVYNRFDQNLSEEGSNLYANCSRFYDTVRIATASWKRVVLIFLLYILALPYLPLWDGFIVFHLYIALVLINGLLPSAGDYQMILNAILHQGLLPSFCKNWSLVVWIVVAIEVLVRTKGDAILALFAAIFCTYLYILLLISWVQFLYQKPPRAVPRLRHIPPGEEMEQAPLPALQTPARPLRPITKEFEYD